VHGLYDQHCPFSPHRHKDAKKKCVISDLSDGESNPGLRRAVV
jgi:hypothetical protein